MPFKIRTKLLIAFMSIIFFIMTVGGVIGYYILSTSDRVLDNVEAVAEEIIAVGGLQHSLEHVLMPANDYLITGDRKYIDDFKVLSREVEERLKKSEELLDNLEVFGLSLIKKEGKSLNDIKIAWQNIREISLKIFDIPNPIGNKDAARIMEEMDYRWGEPATAMLQKWHEGDIEEYKEAIELAEKSRRISWIIIASTVILLLILGAGFTVFYSKLFVKPIEVLHERANAIANGDFKEQLDIRTGDEIQQLANAMNEMAAQLDSLYSNLNGMVEEKTKGLRESEEKYRTMIENSNDWIWTLTADGRLTFINEQAEDVSGYSHEEWLGKTFEPLVLEDDLPMVVDIHNKVVKGEKVHYEVRIKKRAGGIIILSVNASPTSKDGKVIGTISFGRDITEQKQTEAAFRTLVGTAVTNVGAAFFRETVSSLCTWLGVECVIIGELVDEGMVRVLAMQLDGKAVEHYEYALAGTPCESAAQKGYCEYHEGVIQLFPADKDLVGIGAEAYVGIPIRDKNGKVNGIICAVSRHKLVPPPLVKEVFAIIAARAGVEIERKKAEETLRESEEMYRSLFDNMLNGFAYCRMLFEHGQPQDFIYLSVNNSFEALTGLKDVVGKKVTEVIPGIREADPGLFEIYGRVALSGKPERFEMYVESLRMWFWISVYRPHKEHFVAVFDVITERKKAEEAIKESEERFRTITNTAGDAIIGLESPGNIHLWNKKAEEMFGYPADEVAGRDMHDLIVPERYREKAREGLKGFFQTGAGPVVGKSLELTALRKDGTEFPIALSISAMKIQEKWQATGIIRDITERKRAEDELAIHVDELERYMKATVQREFRIKELRDRVQELEKRLKG